MITYMKSRDQPSEYVVYSGPDRVGRVRKIGSWWFPYRVGELKPWDTGKHTRREAAESLAGRS